MKSDREILRQLEEDPNEGMVQLMEKYLGLVHSVAAGLKDPEDVRECINDTFADFYQYRASFDPEKGSLDNYLATIARRRRIDIAERNQKHTAGEYPKDLGTDPVGDWDQRLDVRGAIDQLPPMDAELIRMKYYQGRTLSEIAQALGISYEAAKKRHQRSLAVLKKSLLVLLLLAMLALLAACTVLVLRHFGVLPGYSAHVDPTEIQYVLEERTSVQGEHYLITVEDAWLHDGELSICLRFSWPEGQESLSIVGWLERRDEIGDQAVGRLRVIRGDTYPDEGYALVCFTVADPQLMEDEKGLICSLELDGATLDFRVSLGQPLETEQAGFTVVTEAGGFCAIPRIEEGRLYVQIYPIHPEGYTIDRNLSDYYLKYQFGLSGSVTATGEDGTVLTGAINRNAVQVSEEFCEWDFREAAPGSYVLNIPFAFVTKTYSGNDRQAFSFSGGQTTTLSLPEGTITLGPVENQGIGEDGQYHWWIPLDAQISGPYRMLAGSIQFWPQTVVDTGETVAFTASPAVKDGRLAGYNSTCAVDIASAEVLCKDLRFLWECGISIAMEVQ